jgi:hypothetical protein
MATRSRATFAKRQREIARQERAREKAQKRVERKEHKLKLDRDVLPEDPDIAGIRPGPQPLPYDVLDDDLRPEDLEEKSDEDEDEEEGESA